jgi:hypothetical protein
MHYSDVMADSTADDFDWVSAQGGCTAEQMFKRLLDGARQDVDRRNAATFGRTDGWRFEVHVDDDDHFEVTRGAESAKAAAFVTFERSGPRINITGDGVDVELFAIVSINPHGACRYYVGETEYLGWEVRKLALDTLFFERDDE